MQDLRTGTFIGGRGGNGPVLALQFGVGDGLRALLLHGGLHRLEDVVRLQHAHVPGSLGGGRELRGMGTRRDAGWGGTGGLTMKRRLSGTG